ncbi:MAG: proline racemase family protein [Desulfotignum sp.]|nr:proline racemase family protein [Desulfotignum sp.]MCF8137194.1 proline racemase family protein [Desulfotignum sp.]
MNFTQTLFTVDTHTMGEPTRVVTAGIAHIPGKQMIDKKNWLSQNKDHLRQMLMLEPRGHQDMFGAILTEPVTDGAEAGVIFMDSGGYLDMCGHGSMGVVVVLLETGMLSSDDRTSDNVRTLALDTPAGLIHARAVVENGRVTQVTIRNRESFFCESMEIHLDSIGPVPVDIAYGGNYFALVNAEHLKLPVTPAHIEPLKKLGLAIRKAVNQQFSFLHPASGLKATVDLTEIYENTDPPRNIVVFGAGQVDRSPCGTGTSAKMAFLHHKGRLKPGEPYVYQSVFGTEFRGEVVKETTVGDRPAIVPEITGKAWITGFHQFVKEDTDPYGSGFSMPNPT